MAYKCDIQQRQQCLYNEEGLMPIRRERQGGRAVGLVIAVALMLSGCDYWPPALQTQIEQLRSELQTVTMEKVQLQTQMASLTRAKDDLQAQVEDLARTNRDKSTMIASLQSSVGSLQERLAKSSKPATAKAVSTKASAVKPAAKPAVKTAQKAPVKKKTLTKSTAGH
jgi:septal ring factor EnvC (AmiA/AmiB activator)